MVSVIQKITMKHEIASACCAGGASGNGANHKAGIAMIPAIMPRNFQERAGADALVSDFTAGGAGKVIAIHHYQGSRTALRRQELAQDVLQYPAMLVTADLVRRLQAGHNRKLFLRAAAAAGAHRNMLSRLDTIIESINVVQFKSRQSEAVGAISRHELKREYSHPDQVAAVNSLEAFRQHCSHPQ
jgi:hypothetical protein